jgi:hypothetical protein
MVVKKKTAQTCSHSEVVKPLYWLVILVSVVITWML